MALFLDRHRKTSFTGVSRLKTVVSCLLSHKKLITVVFSPVSAFGIVSLCPEDISYLDFDTSKKVKILPDEVFVRPLIGW